MVVNQDKAFRVRKLLSPAQGTKQSTKVKVENDTALVADLEVL